MRRFILATMAAAALIFSGGNAYAADAPVAPSAARVDKLAVVDVQALLGTSKAGKSIEDQINRQRDKLKEEFSKLEKSLDEMRKNLEADKAKQDTPEFTTRKKEFETKLNDAKKLVQQKSQALDKGAGAAVLELRKAIVKVVADIADKNHYTMVVTRDNVVIAEKDMDITEQVMTQLDKDLPDVKVKVDATDSAPAAPAKK
jgi:outer membrane protein